MIPGLIFVTLVVLAAMSDLSSRRVSNRLNLTILGSGIITMCLHTGGSTLAPSFAGVGVGLLCLLVLFLRRRIGGGDIKLLAAMGAWLGPVGVGMSALGGLALGGIWATCLVLWRTTQPCAAPLRPVPLGVTLAIAGTAVLLAGDGLL